MEEFRNRYFLLPSRSITAVRVFFPGPALWGRCLCLCIAASLCIAVYLPRSRFGELAGGEDAKKVVRFLSFGLVGCSPEAGEEDGEGTRHLGLGVSSVGT